MEAYTRIASEKAELERIKRSARMEKRKANITMLLFLILLSGLACIFAKILSPEENVFLYLFSGDGIGLVKLVVILVAVFDIFRYNGYHKLMLEYEAAFKEGMARMVLAQAFGKYKYSPHMKLQPELIFPKPLLDKRTLFIDAEDFIFATYRDVNFRQADVKVTHNPILGDKKVTDMDGRVFVCHSKKSIENIVIVNRKGGFRSLLLDLPKVAMEDVQFSKKYDVYASDSHDAFYVLTPPIMDYMKNLADVNKSVMLVFYQYRMYILRDGAGGIFEVKNIHQNTQRDIERARCEMEEIKQIISILHMGN